MSTLPNRISAFGNLTPGREVALARQLLEIQSEQELDHFLPLLAMAAPLISNVAGPLLKNLAGGLFGGGSKKRKPRDQQEYFLGGIVKGLLGGELETSEYENEAEFENESQEREQFLGGLLKGIMGGELESAEQEHFLGGIIGKLFGGELEAENYVQEQFLGGILKGLIGGELEAETGAPAGAGPAGQPHHGRHLMRRARRFVRYVHEASCHAAAELANLQRAGHRPSPPELQRIVLAALVASAHRLMPHLASVAFPAGAPPAGPPPRAIPGAAGGAASQPTMLETMFAESTPLGAAQAPQRNGHANSYPLG